MPKSSTYLSPEDVLDRDCLELDDLILESVIPACCEEGCEVEPDGVCPHGNKSILLEIGVI